MNLAQFAQKASQTLFHTNSDAENQALLSDPIDLLKSQHSEVDELFKEIQELSPKAHKSKQKIFETIAKKLEMHTHIEEKVFYPAAKSTDKSLVLEAYEEHDVVKDLIDKIHSAGSEDETFDAKIQVLKEAVQHHVKEEEHDLFPKCRAAFSSDRMKEVNDLMRKEQAKLEEKQNEIHRPAKKKLERKRA